MRMGGGCWGVGAQAGDDGELLAELLDNLVRGRALGAVLQAQEHAAASAADARPEGVDGVLRDDLGGGELLAGELLEGDVLGCLGLGGDLAVVVGGDEALG